MLISIRQVEAFLTVARLRSFTSAGLALHISQSAVSGLIKELERQVGATLFDRTSHVATLSPDGLALLPLAEKFYADCTEVNRFAENLQAVRTGLVRIVGAPLISCTLLPLIIAHFVKTHPAIQVELEDLPTGLVQDALLEGKAEVGFSPARALIPGLECQQLFQTSVTMLSRPDHPLAGRETTWEKIKKTPLVAVGKESLDCLYDDVGGEKEFTVAHIVNQMSTAFALAAAGRGVALAGRFSLLLATGYGLVGTPITPVLRRHMVFYVHRLRKLSPAARIFVDFVGRFAARHDLDAIDDGPLATLAPVHPQ